MMSFHLKPALIFLSMLTPGALLLSSCSNSDSPSPLEELENENTTDDTIDAPTDESNGESVDNTENPNEISQQDQATLQELFPSRDTVFGEEISTIPGPSEVYPDNTGVWQYRLQGNQLVNESFEPLLSHQLTWQRFAELAPPIYLESIFEINFSARDVPPNTVAFTVTAYLTDRPGEQETRLSMTESIPAAFYLAYQNNSSPDYYNHTQVFIHEIGHLIANNEQIDSTNAPYTLGTIGAPSNSSLQSYLQSFWEGEVYDYWLESSHSADPATLMLGRFPDLFISSYATTNYQEDFADTFMRFVENDSIPESGDYPGSDKIIWFWNQPEYVLIREQMRAVM